MNIGTKIVYSVTTLATATVGIVAYNVLKRNLIRTIKKCFRLKKGSEKERSAQNGSPIDLIVSMNWKKIGIIDDLFIYPIKSSEEPLLYDSSEHYDSYEFRDYGMYKQEHEIDFWDGMFLVYNKTKDKFEDGRTHFLLRKMATNIETDIDEVTLSGEINAIINLDMNEYDDSSNHFMMETWNENLGKFSSSNQDVNAWVKDNIETDEDVILAKMIPRDLGSTEMIKKNWSCFDQGYKALEEDETGKFITLPRFVLMTSKTSEILARRQIEKGQDATNDWSPNIIVRTDKPINPFEEQNWEFIRLGDNVILRKVKPVASRDEEFLHYGIYCGLWSGGNAKKNDEVFIY